MTRVISVDGGQVITTGLVNLRRFEQRPGETLVVAELFDRSVRVRQDDGTVPAVVEDLALEQQPNRDWRVTKVFVRLGAPDPRRGPLGGLRRRRGPTLLVPIESVEGLHLAERGQPADRLLEAYEDLKPA